MTAAPSWRAETPAEASERAAHASTTSKTTRAVNPKAKVTVHAPVLGAPRQLAPPGGQDGQRPVGAALDRVVDPAAVGDRLLEVARLGEVADVEVAVRAQHVVEDPLQRLGERRGGVLHPRCLLLPAASPGLRAARAGRGRAAGGQSPRRQREAGDERGGQQRRLDHVRAAGDRQPGARAQRVRMPPSDGARRPGQHRHDRPGITPEHHARHGQQRRPGQHRRGGLARGRGPGCAGLAEEADAGRLHERGGGQAPGQRERRDPGQHARSPSPRRAPKSRAGSPAAAATRSRTR